MPLSRNRLALALAAMVVTVSGLKAQPAGQTRPGEPSILQAPHLKPLAGVNELKSWFNANKEHPRLVLLLSPT
jgi:hypothetical protein